MSEFFLKSKSIQIVFMNIFALAVLSSCGSELKENRSQKNANVRAGERKAFLTDKTTSPSVPKKTFKIANVYEGGDETKKEVLSLRSGYRNRAQENLWSMTKSCSIKNMAQCDLSVADSGYLTDVELKYTPPNDSFMAKVIETIIYSSGHIGDTSIYRPDNNTIRASPHYSLTLLSPVIYPLKVPIWVQAAPGLHGKTISITSTGGKGGGTTPAADVVEGVETLEYPGITRVVWVPILSEVTIRCKDCKFALGFDYNRRPASEFHVSNYFGYEYGSPEATATRTPMGLFIFVDRYK